MQALPLPLSYAAIGIVSILDLCCHWRAVVSTLRPHRQQSCKPTLLALHLIHSLDVHQREGVGHEGKQIARTGVVHQAAIAIYRLLPLLAIRQVEHHRLAITIRQSSLGKLGISLVVGKQGGLHDLAFKSLCQLACLLAIHFGSPCWRSPRWRKPSARPRQR